MKCSLPQTVQHNVDLHFLDGWLFCYFLQGNHLPIITVPLNIFKCGCISFYFDRCLSTLVKRDVSHSSSIWINHLHRWSSVLMFSATEIQLLMFSVTWNQILMITVHPWSWALDFPNLTCLACFIVMNLACEILRISRSQTFPKSSIFFFLVCRRNV